MHRLNRAHNYYSPPNQERRPDLGHVRSVHLVLLRAIHWYRVRLHALLCAHLPSRLERC